MNNLAFSNPTFDKTQSSSLFDMYNQVRRSKNPEQTMQMLLANTPQYQDIMNYIRQNGGDAKTAFYNMAAQRRVDPNTILSQLR